MALRIYYEEKVYAQFVRCGSEDRTSGSESEKVFETFQTFVEKSYVWR